MDIQLISADDAIIQRDSLCESMSSPVLSEFSDFVAPSDNGRDDLTSSLPDSLDKSTTNPKLPVDMLPALDSFVPIIEHLPGLILESNLYHVDQPLLKVDLKQLKSYTRRIRELTLTDTTSTSHPNVAPETLSRLALIQDPESPFLPSLEFLHLVDADEALAYLFFCIAPSLRSLEISQIQSARQITISYFLKELVLNAPQLSNFTIGPGRLSASSLRSSLKFVHLRYLHIIDAADSLDFEFLRGVSSLPELESFIIDARTAEYKQRVFESDADSLAPASSTTETPSFIEYQAPVVTDPDALPFRQLRKLVIVANVVLMGDLVYDLFPQGVKEVSLTLVQNDVLLPLPPPWDKRTANASPADILTVADDSVNPQQDAPILKDAVGISVENLPAPEGLPLNASNLVPNSASISFRQDSSHTFEIAQEIESSSISASVGSKQKKGSRSFSERRLKEDEERREMERLKEAEDERRREMERFRQAENARRREMGRLKQVEDERRREMARRLQEAKAAKLREERQKASNLVSQALFFAHVIEEILTVGTPVSFLVDRLEMVSLSAFTDITSSNPFEFPSPTFRMLLSYPALRELEFRHWTLTSVDESFEELASSSLVSSMSMEKLQLPVDTILNSGVKISTLHQIARYYPRLIHFETLIQQIPTAADSQFDLGTEFIPHGLEFLSVGGRSSWPGDGYIAVATYLCLLFPHLKAIDTHERYEAEDWEYIYSLVKMCQAVRVADEQLRHRAADM